MANLGLSKREQYLLTGVLSVAVFYVGLNFILVPQIGKINSTRAKITQTKTQLRLAESKVTLYKSLAQKVAAQSKIKSMTKEEKTIEVLKSIAWATSRSKLNLNLIKPLVTEGNEIQFTLSCSGRYEQLYRFLVILRSLRMDVFINSMDVGGGGGRQADLSIKILLTAYL